MRIGFVDSFERMRSCRGRRRGRDGTEIGKSMTSKQHVAFDLPLVPTETSEGDERAVCPSWRKAWTPERRRSPLDRRYVAVSR